MPFLRFSRDKRGYEHFYLVHVPSGRRGKGRPRILFWFRTPPNIKVGRRPFPDDVRRTLESAYPNIVFEWDKLEATPIPPADVERWRERRRAEREARQAQPAELAAGSVEPDEDAVEGAGPAPATEVPEVAEVGEQGSDVNDAEEDRPGQTAADFVKPLGVVSRPEGPPRRRRRRRGRRPGWRPGGASTDAQVGAAGERRESSTTSDAADESSRPAADGPNRPNSSTEPFGSVADSPGTTDEPSGGTAGLRTNESSEDEV